MSPSRSDLTRTTSTLALYRARGRARSQAQLRVRRVSPASASLTVLQHQVIQRLRISGHTALAEEALDSWLVGRTLESVYLGGDHERRADFDRANQQARKR
jgi:hypothetical protein